MEQIKPEHTKDRNKHQNTNKPNKKLDKQTNHHTQYPQTDKQKRKTKQ